MYIEGNALILGDSSYLEHHGIRGQKWGVRRYQNKDGTRTAAWKAREDRRVLKKGHVVSRVHLQNKDKIYDNKKYVSTNDEDHKKWVGYFGNEYAHRWKPIYEQKYELKKDVYVANGKDVAKIISTKLNKEMVERDLKGLETEAKAKGINYNWAESNTEDRYSLLLARQTESGKQIIKELVKAGFGAVEDDHGKNVAKDPVIILNPKKNLKKKGKTVENREYLNAYSQWYTQELLKAFGMQHTSIGGTMYIEGNALILGDSSYLEHHGIRGQKWGVRRYQNKDGTRTAAGRKRQTESLKSSQEAKNVNTKIHSYINKQLSSEDLDTGKSNYDFASNLIKDPDFEKVIMPVVQDIRQTKAKYGNKEPYEFTGDEHQAYMNDIDRLDKKTGELAITIGLAEKGEPHKKSIPPEGEYERVDMFRYALARYLDEHSPDGYSDEGDWIYHTSIDDSPHLSHHGIRGQRWGVRRFQNRDGSLTNAGRKRLGYATKGAAQTVGKAFKAGVKAGGKAVKAVKAHHEAAEAKKKEKKKEKASKTRLGVMANKDLFTNEEIRKLNERFKLEDEMKMATLQKGVEIAKAVGTIAQNVGTMAKAYEDVTGQSLSLIKRKAAEEKAKQDAEDRKRKLAKEDAEAKRAEDKEKRDIEDRERRIKLEDEDRVRKQAKEDADAQRAENAEKRAQAKEQRDSSIAVELQRKAKAAADEQEHKVVKAKAESKSAILDVLDKINKIQDHDDDDHNNNNPPGGGIDTWNDDDYLNFFKKTGIIHSDISDPSIIQNGILFVDSSDGLAHHGVKGQRWGVRKFQNADGSLTEKGRKHYEKAIAKEKRKQVSSDTIRGTLERQHPFAVTGAAIMGAVAAGMSIAATGGVSVAAIAAGSAISAAVSAGVTHASYSASEAWEGRGTRMRSKKIAKYENILKQSDMEEGMYYVENGTLFINAGEPYLQHHGVKGMKWGKHLMAGKGVDVEGGGGGGFAEDDEKLKEMAKKAGMSVAEFRTKMASKLSGAASKVGEKVYDAAGGGHKKNAEGWRKMAQEESNAARASDRSSHENSARAASQDRKYGSGGDVYRQAAESDKENAETHRSNAKARSERAASEQAAYEKSLAGRAEAAGKRARKVGNELSTKVTAAKKRLKDVPGELYGSKHRKDFERNARLLEGSTRSAVEIGRDTYKRHGPTSGFNDPTYKATDDAYKRANKQWNNARVAGKKYDRSIAKRVDSIARKTSKARKKIGESIQLVQSAKEKKAFTGGKVKAKKKVTPTSYNKRINDAKNSVEKAARANEAAYKHATEVYRQTGRDSDAYRQAIKRSRTTLWRSLDNQERLKQKRRRPADIGKKRAKHLDDTNAIYTEGTRLVVNSKWG